MQLFTFAEYSQDVKEQVDEIEIQCYGTKKSDLVLGVFTFSITCTCKLLDFLRVIRGKSYEDSYSDV